MAKLIKWGIIGCGNVTEKKSGPALQKAEGSELVAVMRRDAGKAKDYATRHQVPEWYSDADKIIHHPGINAVYIATPPGSHEAYAIRALQAGKFVYVEKPMSVTLASCTKMKEVAESLNGKLCIAHYRRALPMFCKIKQLLAEGAIGDIRSVRISMLQKNQSGITAPSEKNWRVDPLHAGAGLFYDLAPHQLDLVVYFFGNPVSYSGYSANQAGLYEAEDIVTGIMQLPGKILFTGQWCYTTDTSSSEDLFEIIGSKGSIRFPVFGHTVSICSEKGTNQLSFDPPEHIQQPMIQKIVNYFRGTEPNPCSAADAIESMKVMEAFAYGNRIS